MADNNSVTNGGPNFLDFGFFSNNPVVGLRSSSAFISSPDIFAAMNISASGKDEEDDDWGDFVDSSTDPPTSGSLPEPSKTPDPSTVVTETSGFVVSERISPGLGGKAIEEGNRNEAVALGVKKRGPVPLSVFGVDEEEEEEEEDKVKTGKLNSPGNFIIGQYSSERDKRTEPSRSYSSGTGVEISDLIASLYVNTGQSKAENGLNPVLNGDSNSYPGKILRTASEKPNSDMKRWDFSESMKLGKVSSWDTQTLTKNGNPDGLNLNLNGFDASKNIWGLESSPANCDWKTPNVDVKRFDSNEIGSPGTAAASWNSVGLSSQTGLHLDAGVASMTWNPLSFGGRESNLGKDVLCSHTPVVNFDPNRTESNGKSSDIDEYSTWDFKALEFIDKSANQNTKRDEKTKDDQAYGSESSRVGQHLWSPGISDAKQNAHAARADLKQLNSNGIDSKVIPVWSGTGLLLPDSDANGEDWDDDDTGWEFKGAEPLAVATHESNLKDGGKQIQDDKADPNAFSLQTGGQNYRDVFVGTNGFVSESNVRSFTSFPMAVATHPSLSESTQDGLHIFHSNKGFASEENSVAFRDFTGEKKSETKPEKLQGPLPLSIFGDGELENDEQLIEKQISAPAVYASSSNQSKSPPSNVSIGDLVLSLYSQAVDKNSFNISEKPSEIDFSSSHDGNDSNTANDDSDFDDDSWDFQDALSGSSPDSQTAAPYVDAESNDSSTKLLLNDYVDFYTRLKDALLQHALSHLETLQKAQRAANATGKTAGRKERDEEIQDFLNQLYEGIIPNEIKLEDLARRAVSLDEIVQVLREPKFQAVEPELELSKTLLMAQKDWKSVLQLLKHATLMLKILTSVSPAEQANYVSIWSSLGAVCAQELRHGSLIWKQALERNIQGQILSRPQGKSYVLGLGEIYRISEILSATARLYKPWISLNPNMSMLANLRECATIWSGSRLGEALRSISDLSDINYDGSVSDLQQSIEHIMGLSAHSLSTHVLTSGEQTCTISLLTREAAPGMRTVVWCGEHYLLALANLWANLISSDPPVLRNVHNC